MFQYRLLNPIHVLKDLVIPTPNNFKTSAFEMGSTLCIVIFSICVLTSINFYDQSR
jgi:hypothetical protein